jgi:hypothetical protein
LILYNYNQYRILRYYSIKIYQSFVPFFSCHYYIYYYKYFFILFLKAINLLLNPFLQNHKDPFMIQLPFLFPSPFLFLIPSLFPLVSNFVITSAKPLFWILVLICSELVIFMIKPYFLHFG